MHNAQLSGKGPEVFRLCMQVLGGFALELDEVLKVSSHYVLGKCNSATTFCKIEEKFAKFNEINFKVIFWFKITIKNFAKINFF